MQHAAAAAGGGAAAAPDDDDGIDSDDESMASFIEDEDEDGVAPEEVRRRRRAARRRRRAAGAEDPEVAEQKKDAVHAGLLGHDGDVGDLLARYGEGQYDGGDGDGDDGAGEEEEDADVGRGDGGIDALLLPSRVDFAAFAPGPEPPAMASLRALRGTYEPAVLRRHFLREDDMWVRALDAPERLLRRVCVRRLHVGKEEEDLTVRAELRGEEAEFIIAHLMLRRGGGARDHEALLCGIGAVLALTFDEMLEPPFIWLHRRDRLGGLTLAELWVVLDLDEEFTAARARKAALRRALKGARGSGELVGAPAGDSLAGVPAGDGAPPLLSLDASDALERAVSDALDDGALAVATRAVHSAIEAAAAEREAAVAGGAGDGGSSRRRAGRGSGNSGDSVYLEWARAGVGRLRDSFALAPHQLAANMRTERAFEPPDPAQEPLEVASEYLVPGVPSLADAEGALAAAVAMAATELSREPYILAHVRERFLDRVTVSSVATAAGRDAIDSSSPYYGLHTLRRKPWDAFLSLQAPRRREGMVPTDDLMDDEFPPVELDRLPAGLELGQGSSTPGVEMEPAPGARRYEPRVGGPAQFLLLARAEAAGLLRVTLDLPAGDIVNALKVQYMSLSAGFDESHLGAWDAVRLRVLTRAVSRIVTELTGTLRGELLRRAEEAAVAQAAAALRRRVLQGPFVPARAAGETGLPRHVGAAAARVVGVAVSTEPRLADQAVALDGGGAVVDFLQLDGPTPAARQAALAAFVTAVGADVVGVSTSAGMRSRQVKRDADGALGNEVSRGVEGAPDEYRLGALGVPVVYTDDEVPSIVARSYRSEEEFPGYPLARRAAVALARHIQSPLASIAGLFSLAGDSKAMLDAGGAGVMSAGEDVLAMRLHPLQRDLKPTALFKALERVMVEVRVSLHTFVCVRVCVRSLVRADDAPRSVIGVCVCAFVCFGSCSGSSACALVAVSANS
jgi:hypothetical protein